MACEVGIDEVAGDGGGFLAVAAGAAADGLHRKHAADRRRSRQCRLWLLTSRRDPMLTRNRHDHRSSMPSDQSTVKATCRRWHPAPAAGYLSRAFAKEASMLRRICGPGALGDRDHEPARPLAAIGLDWPQTMATARGQTVYFNAWGGGERINDYIAWVGRARRRDYGITPKQVKLADTVGRGRARAGGKTAGKSSGGSVDLIWINGENFAAMKTQALLFGPFAERCPTTGSSTVRASRRRGSISPFLSRASKRPGAWRRSCSSTIPRGSRSRRATWRVPGLGDGPSRPLHLSGAAGLHRQHVSRNRRSMDWSRIEACCSSRRR